MSDEYGPSFDSDPNKPDPEEDPVEYHLKRAKAAKVFGDDNTAQANVDAALTELGKKVKEELEKAKKK